MDTTFASKLSRRLSGAAAIVAVGLMAAPVALAQSNKLDGWQFSVMPYLWLPSLQGDLRYGPPGSGGSSPHVSVDADTLVGDLNFAMMLTGHARKGRWSILADLMYLDLEGDSSKIKSIDFNPGPGPVNLFNTSLDVGTQTKFKGTVFSIAGGYAAIQEPHATLDIIGGLRYIDLKATTNWQLTAAVNGPGGTTSFPRTGSVSQSDHLLDGIVGITGRVRLGQGNWFAPYYLDVGGGDSKLTWQAMAGVGYAYKWGDVVFAYRYLSYESGKSDFVENLSMGGLALGLNFRF